MPVLRKLLGGDQRRSRSLPSLSGRGSSAGVSITPERALQIASVYSCVRLISETGGSLPVGLFERQGRDRVRVDDDPVEHLVAVEPNPNIDAGELWRTVLGWMGIRGNAYVFVERAGSGAPVGLWPIAPTSVTVKKTTGGRARLAYAVKLADDEIAPIPSKGIVTADNMLHYRAFGLGLEGLSPIAMARQQIGTSWAAMAYIGGFFERDASPGGRVEVPGELSDEAFARLEAQWKALHEGFDKAHRLAILEGGAKWEQTSVSPADAMFLDIMKFGRAEIAGIYGVPPHMIGDVERSTSWGSGIEQQGIGFNTYTMSPWVGRLERVTRRLVGPNPKRYFRWNVNGLQRGDFTSRMAGYAQGRQWGWLSANDVLRMEDQDPIGSDGDIYLQPLNMTPPGAETTPPAR